MPAVKISLDELTGRAALARIVFVDCRERLDGLLDVREAEHARPARQDGAGTRILHDDGSSAREVTKRPIADPGVLPFQAGRLGAAEFPARLLDVAPVALGSARDLHGISDMTAMVLQQLPLLLVEDPQRQLERLRGMVRETLERQKGDALCVFNQFTIF